MRSQAKYKWLPTPYRSLLLFIVWLLLNNSVSMGHIVLATILAIIIPIATSPFRTEQPLILKPGIAFRHFLLVLYDIITANMQVAILILGPNKKLSPGFVKVPLDLTQTLPITILASTVSLNLEDEEALIKTIKDRYEAPLKEIFQC